MGIKFYTLGLTHLAERWKIRWDIIEISIISPAFTANERNQW